MNHPQSAHRRTQLITVLAAGAAILAAGCSVGAEPAASATPLPSMSAAATSSGSPTPSPTPSISPSPAASPSPSAPASLPTGWQSCTNSHAGFEIGYPADWHTASVNPQQDCQQFDPADFTIPAGGEYPLTALNAVQTQYLFDPGRSGPGNATCASTVLREPTTVGGRRAVRFEERLGGDGMYADGTMKYGYVIDREGREFAVFTMAHPGVSASDYADWKAVVDQAVDTLRFP
jgi:hypothetical protein